MAAETLEKYHFLQKNQWGEKKISALTYGRDSVVFLFLFFTWIIYLAASGGINRWTHHFGSLSLSAFSRVIMLVPFLSSTSHYFIAKSLTVQTCAIRKNSLPKERGVRNPKVLLKCVYIHSFLSLWRIAPDLTEPNLKIVLIFYKENYLDLQDFAFRKDFFIQFRFDPASRGPVV